MIRATSTVGCRFGSHRKVAFYTGGVQNSLSQSAEIDFAIGGNQTAHVHAKLTDDGVFSATTLRADAGRNFSNPRVPEGYEKNEHFVIQGYHPQSADLLLRGGKDAQDTHSSVRLQSSGLTYWSMEHRAPSNDFWLHFDNVKAKAAMARCLGGIPQISSEAQTDSIVVDETGNVGIGTPFLKCVSTSTRGPGTSAYSSASDARYKKNVVGLSEELKNPRRPRARATRRVRMARRRISKQTIS